ncbi:MAG: TlpA disulfide reductase family protein [Saprospiraceae bacterium]
MKMWRSMIIGLSFLIPTVLSAQTTGEVVDKYRQSLEKIHSISYDVRQLDTFVTGTVWDYPGHVTLLKEETDEVFGLQYSAFKKVINWGSLYDGKQVFDYNQEDKTYVLNAKPWKGDLGAAAAQLVVFDMLYYQDSIAPTLSIKDGEYVLTYNYPDNKEHQVSERQKVIHLDNHSFLPVKVVSSQVHLAKKQVISRFISNLQINQPQHTDQFDKKFLEAYEPEKPRDYENMHKDLIASQVKDFNLETFAGGEMAISEKTGKVVLLDFWEVWCGPCVQSMPKVQDLYETYSDEGLEVMAVLLDKESKDSARLMLDHKKITLPQMIGNQELRDYFKVYAIPQYVLIDRQGKIQFIYQGYDEAIEENIQQLLKM